MHSILNISSILLDTHAHFHDVHKLVPILWVHLYLSLFVSLPQDCRVPHPPPESSFLMSSQLGWRRFGAGKGQAVGRSAQQWSWNHPTRV